MSDPTWRYYVFLIVAVLALCSAAVIVTGAMT
jgi:hypothetical protein